MLKEEVKFVCCLNMETYRCIAGDIKTPMVVITEKQLNHMAEHHPEAYETVLIELRSIISNPDYILKDRKNDDTGIVIKNNGTGNTAKYIVIILRISTDRYKEYYHNSIISGWIISEKRKNNYLRNLEILYHR